MREAQDAPATIVLGMPANQFSLYDFEHFVFQCAQRGRYTQIPQLDFIPEIDSLGGDLSLLDRYLVYPLAIWAADEYAGVTECRHRLPCPCSSQRLIHDF